MVEIQQYVRLGLKKLVTVVMIVIDKLLSALWLAN